MGYGSGLQQPVYVQVGKQQQQQQKLRTSVSSSTCVADTACSHQHSEMAAAEHAKQQCIQQQLQHKQTFQRLEPLLARCSTAMSVVAGL
jgi:hypothetical protein